MKVIPYRVTLLEPLLATRIAGDPNSGVSYPYVPGSMVRGAIVAAYMRAKTISKLDAGAEDARRLFFDGRTRYLNAYPADANRVRSLPTPRSLFHVKGEESPIYDFALEVIDEVNDEKVQFVAAARDAQPFCRIDDKDIFFIAPERRVNVHTQRDRVKGRATEASGAVFQYDALEEGQTFAGWILVDVDTDADLVSSLLRQIYRLGGSSNSGYGRVAVEVDAPQDVQPWREIPERIKPLQEGKTFVVTLLSDTLVRNPNTGHYTWDLRPALQQLLGVDIEYVQPTGNGAEQRSVWRLEEVGGFNRTWGLPLPQAQAIVGGSAFVFRAGKDIPLDVITNAEWRGIGERRAEGFGRLVFNWQTKEHLTKVDPPKPRVLSQTMPQLDGVAQEMAQRMAERMLRHELDRMLRKAINDMQPPEHLTISNAQLSRLRIIVREALPTGDLARLQKYLDENIKTRRTVRDQFERTRLGQERLSQWLEERLSQPITVWDKIGAQALSKRIGANVLVSTRGDEALAREYTIRLIDGVLAKLAKESRREDGGRQ
ncbi:type III-D CRISPR-associated RAMP protein Csx10 [Chloroflexus sp.]|uniref:type III-D CRISPR-associated RAMP protein Csx10 n=1 Tax=Chloroflexus sp. TaxID=1904827 RepID=UPI004049DD76